MSITETPTPQAPQPLNTIWTDPRGTIARIVDENPERSVVGLAALLGIVNALARASNRGAGDDIPLIVLLAIVAFVGPLAGILSLWIMGWFVRVTGRWIGGRGTPQTIRAAIAWASVPLVFTLVLDVVKIVLFGKDMFTTFGPAYDAPLLWVLHVTFWLDLVALVWSLWLACACVGEVQGFSGWKALANLVLATALYAFVLVALIFGLVALVSLAS